MKESRLGEHLRSVRRAAGVGLRALASSVEVDRAHLSRIESGKVIPSDDLLLRLAEALGEDLDELRFLAGRLPYDVEEIIRAHPREATIVLRNAFHTEGI